MTRGLIASIEMKLILKLLGFCLIAAISGAVAALVLRFVHLPKALAADDIKYTDFLSITLTALSLMITLLGLFLAAAGVIGWATLESKLRSHSVEYLTNQLEKDGKLRKDLEDLLVKIASTGIEGVKAPENEESPYGD